MTTTVTVATTPMSTFTFTSVTCSPLVATLVLAPLSSDAAAPATGIKLMLVDSSKQVMIKPSNMSDWRQVQLQATVFNLATASDPLATAASTASGAAAGSGTGAAAAADVPPTAADDAGDN
ncbi:unnamed protein product [Tilletia caries]|nr:unnamed protein product [Tilletia caries]